MFTYRNPSQGIKSKADLRRLIPLLKGIRPLNSGRVFSPRRIYYQCGHLLDDLLMEIAAILHPKLFPGYKLKFFRELN